MKLWQTERSAKLHPLIERFTIGDDLRLDEYLIGYDCAASVAHAYMLKKEGYLKSAEFQKVKAVLKDIFRKAVKRKYRLQNTKHEDGHSAIEHLLSKKLGQLGGKIHLGRSRNDQSATAIRLFAKDELLQIREATLQTVTILLELAEKYARLPMPGYTHTRPAMVSSLGHFFAAFAESLADDYVVLKSVSELTDACPLGAAAGYGSTVPTDRKLTARLLGFARVQNNTLATQLSRGKLEAAILGALVNIALTLSRLSNDLIYFSAPEFDFFSMTDRVATGSSIMPQKQNPDALEVIRASASILIGCHAQVAGVVKGLPAGYQRDLQLTKQPFVDSVKLSKRSLTALQIVLKNLIINEEKLKTQAGDPNLFAANLANDLVLKKGLSFREAYRKVKEGYEHATFRGVGVFDDAPRFNAVKNIEQKRGLGMPGNLNLTPTIRMVSAGKRVTVGERRKFDAAMKKIWKL